MMEQSELLAYQVREHNKASQTVEKMRKKVRKIRFATRVLKNVTQEQKGCKENKVIGDNVFFCGIVNGLN